MFNISYLIPSGKVPVSLLICSDSHIVAIKGEAIQREVCVDKAEGLPLFCPPYKRDESLQGIAISHLHFKAGWL